MTDQSSSVAYRVAAAFARLHAVYQPHMANNGLITLWQLAFPTEITEPSVTELIGQLARSLRLLEAQLELSSKLPNAARKSNIKITQDLASMTKLEIYNQPISSYIQNISDLRLGSLESCGVALSLEFPELVVSPEDKSSLTSELLDLLAEITGSPLGVDAKVAIRHYVQAILWALNNQEFVGSTLVREMSASLGITVHDEIAREKAKPDSEKKHSRLAMLGRTRDVVLKALRLTFEIDVVGHGVLDFVHDASAILISNAS